MDVLVFLASRPGEVIPKERIFRHVWADTFVGDDVLTRAGFELRRAFRDDAKSPRVIETIPRRGYRLIAPVSFPEESSAAGEPDFRDRSVRSGRLLTRRVALLALAVVPTAWFFWLARDPPKTFQLTNPVLLTTAAGNKDYPTWRPDGSEVAYQSDQAGNWDIWVTQGGAAAPETSPAITRGPTSIPAGRPTEVGSPSGRVGTAAGIRHAGPGGNAKEAGVDVDERLREKVGAGAVVAGRHRVGLRPSRPV
jgi:hypothetical protein